MGLLVRFGAPRRQTDMTEPARSRYASVFRADLFAHQVHWVTGGGSGIGRCVAHELASLGATVVISGRTQAKLDAVAAEIHADGGICHTQALDEVICEEKSHVYQYEGGVYATNLGGEQVLGIQTVADIASLPDDSIDLVFVCTPATTNPDILRACAAKGIRAAFLTSAGYGEAGEAGTVAIVDVIDLLAILRHWHLREAALTQSPHRLPRFGRTA